MEHELVNLEISNGRKIHLGAQNLHKAYITIDDLQKRIVALEEQLRKERATSAKKSEKFARMRTQHIQLCEEKTHQAAECDALTTKLCWANDRIAQQAQEIETLRMQVLDLTGEKTQLETALQEEKERCLHLQEKINQHDESIDFLQKKFKDFEQKYTEQETTLKDVNKRIDEMEHDLREQLNNMEAQLQRQEEEDVALSSSERNRLVWYIDKSSSFFLCFIGEVLTQETRKKGLDVIVLKRKIIYLRKALRLKDPVFRTLLVEKVFEAYHAKEFVQLQNDA